MTLRLLLLSGTAEARAIAAGLAVLPGIAATAALAGVTQDPAPLPLPTRIGGFGGDAGFADWLAAERIGAVIDATHPFAARITPRTARVCAGLGLPHITVKRPPWRPEPGDRWTGAADEAAAARLIPPDAAVFLATGRQRLDRFAGLAAARVWIRVVDPPEIPFPFPAGAFVVAHPPFPVAEEVALFDRLGIDWLVARNAGGAAGRAKLDAARLLGVNVAMIARPALPEGLHLTDVAGALAWARALAAA